MSCDSITVRDGHPCDIWQGWRHVGSVMKFENDLLSDEDYREKLNDKQKSAWDKLVRLVDQ